MRTLTLAAAFLLGAATLAALLASQPVRWIDADEQATNYPVGPHHFGTYEQDRERDAGW